MKLFTLTTITTLSMLTALSASAQKAKREPKEEKAEERSVPKRTKRAKVRKRVTKNKRPRQKLAGREKVRSRTVRTPRAVGVPKSPLSTKSDGVAVKSPKQAAPGGDLPGEKEFNECVRIPAHRRIKVTLKQNSELKDLVAWISSMTCKKFILADSLRAQKITIISPTPVTAREAYRAFLSSLEVMGLTVVPVGRYLKIVQGNWAIQSPIPTYGAEEEQPIPATDAVVTQMVQVKNVDVNDLLLVLNKMKSRSGDVTAYKPTNMLIITDSGNNVRRLVQIISELDIAVAGEKIWVVRLRYADVEDINKILSQIFAHQRGRSRVPRGRPGTPQDAGSVSASKIVPDTSTNSLIIVASPAAFHKIASLIKKLDVDSEGANQRINVHYLENADAEDMANTLSGLTGGGRYRGRARRRGRQRRAPRRPGGAQTATLFEGDVKISADKATNSLVIVATTKDFLNLRRVIKKLDIPRRQVFVEASILEIRLDKGRKVGFAYHGGGTTGSGDSESIIFGGVEHSDWNSLSLNPLALMGLAVGARGAVIEGSSQLLGTNIPAFGVMFQALQNNNNVNVLSSPHILTTDNEEAEISVGENIPFQGAFLGSGLSALAGQSQDGSQTNYSSLLPSISVQRQDVAIKLKLTPHVNESDMVRLELEQEVSDIASQNFNGLGPSTSKRTAKTVVVVRDQQTVVIGGLMGNQVRDTISKVPLLGDIPILGFFFRYKQKSIVKTNLLIVLTPYVIRDQSDLRRIFKKKLEERREFIDRYTSFKHADISPDIDFRHKRGLLAEINRVGIAADQEAKLINDARKKTMEKVEPVEMPRGMGPSKSEPTSNEIRNVSSPGRKGPDKRPPPRIHPSDSIRIDRPPR